MDKLNPILLELKLGRKLSLAWDVGLQGCLCAGDGTGLLSYECSAVWRRSDGLLNNKVNEAFEGTAAAFWQPPPRISHGPVEVVAQSLQHVDLI